MYLSWIDRGSTVESRDVCRLYIYSTEYSSRLKRMRLKSIYTIGSDYSTRTILINASFPRVGQGYESPSPEWYVYDSRQRGNTTAFDESIDLYTSSDELYPSSHLHKRLQVFTTEAVVLITEFQARVIRGESDRGETLLQGSEERLDYYNIDKDKNEGWENFQWVSKTHH